MDREVAKKLDTDSNFVARVRKSISPYTVHRGKWHYPIDVKTGEPLLRLHQIEKLLANNPTLGEQEILKLVKGATPTDYRSIKSKLRKRGFPIPKPKVGRPRRR